MMLEKIRSRMPKGSLILGIVAVVNVVLAYFREATIAYFFGTSAELDTFLAALTIPKILAVNFTQLTVAVVLPLYVGYRQAGRNADATALVQKWFLFSGATIAAVCAVLFLGADLLMRALVPGFDAAQRAEAASWLRTLLPYVWLLGVSGVFKVVLNSHDRFFVPAISSELVSITVIVFCALGANRMGIGSLSAGFVAGGMLGFLWQLVNSRRFEPRLPALAGLRSGIELPLAAGGAMIINYFAKQFDIVIDRGFASDLSAGSIAAYSYAISLTSVPNSIITATIGTALFPMLSRMAAGGNFRGALRTARRWSMALAGLSIVPVLLLVFFRTEITSLLLQRGAFDATSVRMTADVLGVSFFLVPVQVVMVLFIFLLLSQRRNWTITAVSITVIALKVAFNIALVHRYGLVGLALSSLLATILSTSLLVVLAWKRMPKGLPS